MVEAPVFAADGTLVTTPGYNPFSETYYAAAAGFTVPPIPDQPSAADVDQARDRILDLIGDFPFAGPAERAHAVALFLLPFARPLIEGPTPLHLIEAPSPGTGKTLLVDVLLFPSTGRRAPTMTEGRDEDEWRKRVTAKIIGGAGAVFLDNLRRRLNSAALSSAITAGVWEDRVLGHSEMARVAVRCVWVATGNNVALSGELARRTVRIRLDAKVDRPWLRAGFRHQGLFDYAAAHRAELVAAGLTLVRAWIAAGQPAGKQRLGMFEAWARTMGGILAVAGVDGFLSNLMEFYERADAEGTEIRDFLGAWWEQYEGRAVTAADLLPLALDHALDVDAKTEHGRRVRFGRLLAENRDRRYRLSDHLTVVVEQGDKTRDGVAGWHLVGVPTAGSQAETATDPAETPRETPQDKSATTEAESPTAGFCGVFPGRQPHTRARERGAGKTLPDPADPAPHSEACDCRGCIP